MKKILIGLGILVGAFLILVSVARHVSSTVIVERTFNAPLERVWFLWNDTESMKNWWSPKDFTAPVIQNDFREGGLFLLSMKSPNGEMFWNTGTYTQIIPNQKIVSAFSFSDSTGKVLKGSEIPVPGAWPDAITVTVDFKEANRKTTVRVQEDGIPLIMKVLAKMGWEQQFDKFATLLP